MKQILLLLDPLALRTVIRPSFTVALATPSSQCAALVGVPSMIRVPSASIL